MNLEQDGVCLMSCLLGTRDLLSAAQINRNTTFKRPNE